MMQLKNKESSSFQSRELVKNVLILTDMYKRSLENHLLKLVSNRITTFSSDLTSL
jgi:hypothetical protein